MKQVIIIRKDLNMRKGKMVAQGCHASIGAISKELYVVSNFLDNVVTSGRIEVSPDVIEWLSGLQKKICVGVDSEQELLALHAAALRASLPCHLVKDAGLTEFKEPTYTAVAIGPATEQDVDFLTGHLKLL